MERQTILHFVLLKKISNLYPHGKFNDKFLGFKQKATCSMKKIQINNQQTQIFQKYHTSREQKTQLSQTSTSFNYRPDKKKKKKLSQNCKFDVSGWQISQEDNLDYFQKIKENMHKFGGQNQCKLLQPKISINKISKKEILPDISSMKKTQPLKQRCSNHNKNVDDSNSQKEMIKITYFNSYHDKENTFPLKIQHKKFPTMPFRSYKKNLFMSKTKRLSCNQNKESLQNYFQ